MEKISPSNVHQVLGRSILADGYDIVIDFEKSHGSFLYDSKNEKEYLDFFSFYSSMPIGYNHPRIVNDPEFQEKLKKVSNLKVANVEIYSVELAEFVSTFTRIAGHKHFESYFFIDSGTLAVENAIKAAFDWKVRKNFAKGYQEEKGTQVIHFKQAFHGRSGYTLSLSNTEDPRKTMYFPKFNWPRISNPKCSFPLKGENLKNVIELEKQALSEINAAIDNNPDDIACILIEPIQAEGGDNHFRPEFFRELRKIADEREILLIFDEVQTGIGGTGNMWGFETIGVLPDLIAFGKKTQVCGVAAAKRVNEVDSVFKVSSRIDSTWGGSLTDMVRCTRFLEIIEEENLVENARELGAYMLANLKKMSEEFPGMFTNIRGKGLFIAFDLPEKEQREKFFKKAYDNGLLLLVCGNRSIRLRPALNIRKEDIDAALNLLRKTAQQMIPLKISTYFGAENRKETAGQIPGNDAGLIVKS
jgi:L-lysine 6-transaminase